MLWQMTAPPTNATSLALVVEYLRVRVLVDGSLEGDWHASVGEGITE